MRIFVTLALAMALLVPVVAAQKTPNPTPPPSAPSSHPANPTASISESTQPAENLVIEDAEKSGLKAEHVLLITRFPQLHLLLAEIFAEKKNYATAISEIQIYLALVPHAKEADQLREQLAKLKSLNGSESASKNPDHE